MTFDRRQFIAGSALGLTAIAEAGFSPQSAYAAEASHEGLQRLLEGNERFVADRAICPQQTARRIELASGQSPFAIVLGCSDSRVPVETVFDQIPGSIFVVRIAGNFVENEGLGSIEFSIAALKSSLILVLGHTSCGAVSAAVSYVKEGTTQPGHIQRIVEAIEPAARATKSKDGDWVRNAIVQNIRDNVAALTSQSTIVADAHKAGSLAIYGGLYDLHSGKVSIV